MFITIYKSSCLRGPPHLFLHFFSVSKIMFTHSPPGWVIHPLPPSAGTLIALAWWKRLLRVLTPTSMWGPLFPRSTRPQGQFWRVKVIPWATVRRGIKRTPPQPFKEVNQRLGHSFLLFEKSLFLVKSCVRFLTYSCIQRLSTRGLCIYYQ